MNSRGTTRIIAATLVAAGIGGGGVLAATPAHSAPGEFVYTPALSGSQRAQGLKAEQKTVMNPKADVCIKTENGTKAKNYTLSNVQLYTDATCHLTSIVLQPGQSNGAPFSSIKALK